MYDGGRYNYNGNLGPSGTTLTLTCTPVHTADGVDYYNGQPAVALGVIWFILDVISELGHKIGALFTLVTFVLTPVNMDILGFGLDDLSGIPLLFVIAIFALMYIFVGLFLFSIIGLLLGALI